MLKSKTFQKIQIYWIFFSVILFFAGLVLSSSSVFFGNVSIGQFFTTISGISIFLYFIISLFQWFKFKTEKPLENFKTAYVILSILMMVAGLVGAFLTFPDGMKVFLIGVGMMGAFWIFKLISFIFMKEEDFDN